MGHIKKGHSYNSNNMQIHKVNPIFSNKNSRKETPSKPSGIIYDFETNSRKGTPSKPTGITYDFEKSSNFVQVNPEVWNNVYDIKYLLKELGNISQNFKEKKAYNYKDVMACHDNIKRSQLHVEDLVKNADFSHYQETNEPNSYRSISKSKKTHKEAENPLILSSPRVENTEICQSSIKKKGKNVENNISQKVNKILQKVKDAKIENEYLTKVAKEYLDDFSLL